jgi:hypothetical protein
MGTHRDQTKNNKKIVLKNKKYDQSKRRKEFQAHFYYQCILKLIIKCLFLTLSSPHPLNGEIFFVAFHFECSSHFASKKSIIASHNPKNDTLVGESTAEEELMTDAHVMDSCIANSSAKCCDEKSHNFFSWWNGIKV